MNLEHSGLNLRTLVEYLLSELKELSQMRRRDQFKFSKAPKGRPFLKIILGGNGKPFYLLKEGRVNSQTIDPQMEKVLEKLKREKKITISY